MQNVLLSIGRSRRKKAQPRATGISDRIPIEIYEKVIEHMDRSMLPSAALISRAWYPRAAFCLYYTVVIASRASYDLLVRQLRMSSRVQRWLQSTHIAVIEDSLQHRGGIPFLDAFPLVFGHVCLALQVLDITHILRPDMDPTFHRALRQFKHIVSLRLHEVKLSNIAQLRQIVCAFMSLEELVLENVLFVQPLLPHTAGARLQDDLSRFRDSCNIRLKRLRVKVYSEQYVQTFGCMTDWLVCSGICSSLVELVALVSIRRSRNMDHAAKHSLNRLLEISGQSLTSFHCQCFLQLHDYSPCKLVHNTALRQLTLELSFNPYESPEDSDFAHAASELRGAFSTVRSDQLRHITVRFKFNLNSPMRPPLSRWYRHSYAPGCSQPSVVNLGSPMRLRSSRPYAHSGLLYAHSGILDDRRDPRDKEDFSQSCKKLEADSRSLNDVLVAPYFDALKDVKIEMHVVHAAHGFVQAMAPLLRRLFMPWHERGILSIATFVNNVPLDGAMHERRVTASRDYARKRLSAYPSRSLRELYAEAESSLE